MRKNILFVSYGGGHINLIEPIVDSFLKDKNYNVKLLALTSAFKKVSNKYDKTVLKGISDYLFLFDRDVEEVFKNGLDLFNENYNSSANITKLEVLAYLGVSFTEQIKKLGIHVAVQNYKDFGRQSFLPVEAMKAILDYEKTDIVVSTTSPRFEKAALLAAKLKGIKSFQLLDLYDDNVFEPQAQYTVVMNNVIRKNLIEKGFSSNEILVFGQPAIEKTIRRIERHAENNLISLHTSNDRGKNKLVYFSQPPLIFNKDGVNLGSVSYDKINPVLFKLLDDLTDKYEVFFRIHPNEDIINYEKYFYKFKSVINISEKLSHHESISFSDLTVTPYSTVALESICVGKTVFTYKPDYCDHFPVKFMKIAPFIYSDSFDQLKYNILNSKIVKRTGSEILKLDFIKNFKNFIDNGE
jgi:hypothetical protein